MKEKLKCVLLFKDDFWLGHLPFFRIICASLLEKHEVYIFLYSDVKHTNFPWANIIVLPQELLDKKYNKKRNDFLCRHIQTINIDIFLVDFFPFGRFESIFDIDIISWHVHKNWGKVLSFMRDIYYWKEVIKKEIYSNFLNHLQPWNHKNFSKVMEKWLFPLFSMMKKAKINDIYYVQLYIDYVFEKNIIDGILVFWDKNFFDIRDEFLLSDQDRLKWYHVWYIPGNKSIRYIWNEKVQKKILISTWWNVTSRKDFIALLQFFVTKESFSIEVLIWPYVNEYIKREIEELIQWAKHINISMFKENFWNVLNNSDYFFWFGGYGTFQDLFYYKGKAFIMANYNLSNFRHRYYEQKYRTKIFEKNLNVQFLDDFSHTHLEKCLWEYKPRDPDISEIQFCNMQRLEEVIHKLYTNK